MKTQQSMAILALILVGLAPRTPLWAVSGQQAQNIQEWELVQKFKAANASFEKAKDLYLKRKFGEAKKYLKECLGIMPEHNEAHFFLAMIAYQDKDYEKALEHMGQAQKYFDYTVKILAKQHQDLMLEVQKAVRLNEENIMALKQAMGRAATPEARTTVQRQINEQERQMAIARDRLKNPIPIIDKMPAEYPYLQGNILFRLERWAEAEAAYRAAIQADPLHLNSYNNLVNLYYLTHQYDQALAFIEQAEKNGLAINAKLKKAVLQAMGR